jgi:hypothetical protein
MSFQGDETVALAINSIEKAIDQIVERRSVDKKASNPTFGRSHTTSTKRALREAGILKSFDTMVS